jgi:hypothetical protein
MHLRIFRAGLPLLTTCLAALLAAAPARAGSPTFDTGHYLVDLPDGYELEGVTGNGTVHKFKGKGPVLVMVYQTDGQSLDEAQKQAVGMVAGTLPGLAPTGEVAKLTVNGHPASFDTYQAEITAAGMKIMMETAVGVVLIEGKGTIQLIATYSAKDAWGPSARKVLDSVRLAGEKVRGEEK